VQAIYTVQAYGWHLTVPVYVLLRCVMTPRKEGIVPEMKVTKSEEKHEAKQNQANPFKKKGNTVPNTCGIQKEQKEK